MSQSPYEPYGQPQEPHAAQGPPAGQGPHYAQEAHAGQGPHAPQGPHYAQGPYYTPGPPTGHAPPPPPQPMPYSPTMVAGDKAAQTSLVLGIVGMFIAGVIFGPLAIWQAGKAEEMGVPATAGRVLGWIGLILGILQILMVVVIFVLWGTIFAAMVSTY